MNAPSRVGSACGSVVEPDGVKRKIVSHFVGCAAQVALGMKRAGSWPLMS